jgi:hypothetical protein
MTDVYKRQRGLSSNISVIGIQRRGVVWCGTVKQGNEMDVKEALDQAGLVLSDYEVHPVLLKVAARAAIVAFLERVPEFGEATVSANYAERPVNTPSRILAAIKEAQS